MSAELPFMMSGVVFGLAAGLAPGPLLALVLAQSVRYGAMEGSKVAVAPLITDPPLIALSVLVFTSLASTDIVVGVVALTGAALLAYLAFDSVTVSEADRSHGIGAGSVWKGFSANLLNPHPYLFWIVVGAPTLVKASAVGRVAVLAFLAGMYGSLVGVKILVAVAAGRGSVILSNRVKGGAKLDHRGGGKLDHPAVEWLKAVVRRRGQDAGAAAGWRAFLLCSRR